MPVLGLTMEEGTVAEWLKHEGDAVRKDEPLLTVEMDKGTQEVPSPVAGVLRRIVVQAGTTVPVRTLIAEIGDASEVLAPVSAAPSPAPASVSPAPAASGLGDLPSRPAPSSEAARVSVAASGVGAGGANGGGDGARLFASPRARMRARALGVELGALQGSGPLGRIVEAD